MIVRKILLSALLLVAVVASAAPPNVNEALASQRDLWGELAMQQPGGPSYEFFEKLLPLLRYVNTSYREYPLALSAPLAEKKARLISNGSAVNIPITPEQHRNWYGYPIGVTFYVGDLDEIYGHDAAHLIGPTFERGYLPVVRTSYQGITEEAFVPAEGTWADHAAVFVKFSSAAGKSPISATVDCKTALHVQGNALCDAQGHTFVLLGDRWNWDDKQKRLTASLDAQNPLLLAVLTDPASEPTKKLDAATYDQLRTNCINIWQGWIDRCAQLNVPEEIVTRAWKTSIIGELMIASGDRMYYSAGNVYRNMWVAENGDAAKALAAYGLLDTVEPMAGPILKVNQKGLDYHNAGFKLQFVAYMYWMSRDAAFVRKYQDLWQPEVERILSSRQKDNGLLPKESYCGDIHTVVYSLNSNANSWRGLHDIAAVLADMGQSVEAARLSSAAAEFRTAILAAIQKSERLDAKPPFIPVALFGEEKPYEALTATVMGTYWNLMIPYVIGSGILDESRTAAVLDYLQTRGGLCMGMLRIHQHSGLFANEDGLDDGYTSRYVQALLRRDEADRVLVSFYGKLAQGFTRDTFVGAEGTSLVALDPGGRPMYLPPNSTGNGFFLGMLRDLLVQDESVDDNGVPDKLRLMFATPRAWLEDGKTIEVKNAPTVFGPVSVVAHSDLAHSKITVEVSPPPRTTHSTQIRLRLPLPWKVLSANIGEGKLSVGLDGTFDITSQRKPFTLKVNVSREVSAAPLHHYADHSKLMMYADDHGAEHSVQTPQDWQHRRQDILLSMQAVMGDLPSRRDLPPLDVKVTEQVEGDGFVREKLTFVAEGQERVPAYLFVPSPALAGKKYPAILALHQTTSVGKMEPAGLAGNMPYGLELARRGYVVLCPDEPSFGEYQYDFHTNGYVSGSMKAIANHMRCIDLLTQRPEVDAERIGVIGHSLGGHNSLFVAVFDPRIKVVVTSCGWTPFADYRGGDIQGWTSDRYMPRLRDVYHLNVAEVPFDFYEVIAAIAPRAVLSISPIQDDNFDVRGVKKAIPVMAEVYRLLGAPDALQVIYPPEVHSFPPENREKAYAFLDAHLGHATK